MFNGLKAIAAKEVIHIRRDPITLVIALLIPLVQLTIFGYALDLSLIHI